MKERILNSFKNLKTFNRGLYIVLILIALFPAILQTIRTFFLSSTIDVSEFDVLGQMEWFDLINESIIALLILPLYSILSGELEKDKTRLPRQVFKSLITVFIVYFILSIIIYGIARYLVDFMNPGSDKLGAMVNYLNLETIAFIIGIIPQFVNVVFIVLGKKRNFYIYIIVHSLLLILADYLLIPSYGVNGVAYSNILINSVLTLITIGLLFYRKSIKLSWFDKQDKGMHLNRLKIGTPSFLQSLLDNVIYIVMVSKMVNAASNAGNYWVANNFIWLWLLIPVTALGEIIRKDSTKGYESIKQSNYYFICTLIVVIWLVLIPTWLPFFEHVEKLENASVIFEITLKLFGFYIAYAFTIIPDNIFIGLGKTKYSLLNSIIINVVYYGIFYLVFTTSNITMSLNLVILMFGFGMVVHLIVSIFEEKILLVNEITKTKRNQINLKEEI